MDVEMIVAMLAFLKYFIQLIISPMNGWVDISSEGDAARRISFRGMSMMLAIMALSSFTALVYKSGQNFVTVLQMAIVNYVIYWVTFFFADFLFSLLLPRLLDGQPDEVRVKTFLAYNVSILSLMVLITNLLPFPFAIIGLLPIYVAVIMWRGMKFLEVPEPVLGKFMLLAIFAVIIPPMLLNMLFEIVL